MSIIIFTLCLGFASQYPDMNALKETYDGDLEIIAVPSSNFFNVIIQLSLLTWRPNIRMTMSFQQEPSGDGAEIMNAIQHVRPGNMFEPNFMISARSGHDYTTHA